MSYCDECGNLLEVRKNNIEWYCSSCKRHVYSNPVPTIDAVLFDEKGRVLLGRRSHMPYEGKLNLPGGFVDPRETLEEAIARELYEELGLEPSDYGELKYVSSRVGKSNHDGKIRNLVQVVMVGDIKHQGFQSNDEVSQYFWKLPSELSLDILTNKAEYQHIMKATEFKKSNES